MSMWRKPINNIKLCEEMSHLLNQLMTSQIKKNETTLNSWLIDTFELVFKNTINGKKSKWLGVESYGALML